MNKATSKASELANIVAANTKLCVEPNFDVELAKLAGHNVNTVELKKEIDAAFQARAQELSSKLLSRFRMGLGL